MSGSPLLDQAGLGGGAAHVERHQPVEAEHLGIVTGGERARRRSALDHAHRVAPGGFGADHPAGAQHDQRRVGKLLARETVAQPAQIGLRDRHRVGVDARGRGARELADLRGDVRRQRDEQVGQELADPLADGALVRRIGEAVEKADGERAHIAGLAVPRRPRRPAACRARPARCRRRGCAPPPRRSARRGPAAPETRSAGRTSRSDARCGCAGRRESRR